MTRGEPPARTGLLGGTFNPIHVAHLRAAEDVAEALGLARVVFVPSATPPHKKPAPGEVMAPAELRLAWVARAVAGNPCFAVDDLEVARGGLSYSVETLRAYGARLAPERPVFVIGQDAMAEIHTWKEPAELLALAHFAVMTRPPLAPASLAALLPPDLARAFAFEPDGAAAHHREAGTWMRRVPVTPLDVSASDLRARIRGGRSVRYLIPDAVREAVLASGVYAEITTPP
jgi:nicotinate-nucleotide adenylyltransferase